MTVLVRLMKRVNKLPSGCWMWTGYVHPTGYGRIRDGAQMAYTHRVAYKAFVGEIPDGHEVDHVCHNSDQSCGGGNACLHRACINPAHLEAVSHRENGLRGRSLPAANARKTHCVKGHAYDEINTYWISPTRRACRACNRTAVSRYKARKAVSL